MTIHEKAELRRRCRRIREGMSTREVVESSEAVCAHLADWPPLRQATTILGFLAFRNEIDLRQLMELRSSKRWLVPRVVEGVELAPGQKPYLALHSYQPTRLVRHRFGMQEPEPGLPHVEADEVEMILVPGVAFDHQGGRLGFGGGFYDRLLPLANRGIRVGVNYDQLVLDSLPMSPWDCRVEWLVTPRGLIRTAQK